MNNTLCTCRNSKTDRKLLEGQSQAIGIIHAGILLRLVCSLKVEHITKRFRDLFKRGK